MALTNNLFIGAGAWASGTYGVGDIRTNIGNGYMCVRPGSSTAAPTTTGPMINNGGAAWWTFLAAVDFTDLASAQASLPGTFTQPIKWQFWNCGAITTSLGTPFLTIYGNTTTPTNNLTLTPAPGQGIRDALRRGVSPLAIGTPAAGVGFLLPVGNGGVNYINTGIDIIIDGMQFQDPSSNSNSGTVTLTTASSATIRNSVFDVFGQSSSQPVIYLSTAGATLTNNLIVDRQTAGTNGPVVIFDTTTAAGAFINNGIIAVNSPGGTSVGVQSNSGSAAVVAVRNSYLFGHGTPLKAQNVAGAIVVDHCCTDGATGTFASTADGFGCTDNGNELFAKSAANQFVSATADFRLKAKSDCVNAGTTDTTDVPSADDMAGTHRPQGSAWDIGPWERPAPSIFRRSPIRLRL